MKQLTIIIMILCCMTAFGQIRNFNDIPKDILEQLDKMGVDNSSLLNSYESTYLNVIFKDSLNGFDFTNKNVGFIKAGSKRNKVEYFKEEKDRFYRNYTTINGYLQVFDTTQKEESGGYDAVIVYWSKFSIPTEKLVKRLKRKLE